MTAIAPAIDVANIGPCEGALLRWSIDDEPQATVILKATVSLVDGGVASVAAPRRVRARDVYRDPDRISSLAGASELVPFLPSAGIVLTGHAHAPPGSRVTEQTVRLLVYGERTLVDKALRVIGDRTSGEREPEEFEHIPVVYERAYGGPLLADNPVGVGADDDSRALPNVVDPNDAKRPAGFGPRSRYWGPHGERVRRALRDAGGAWRLPGDFSFEWLHAAPADQTVSYLTGKEWIAIEGMNAKHGRFQTRLPDLRAEARLEVAGEIFEIDLLADGLIIDADALHASVLWRGQYALGTRDEVELRAYVQVAGEGKEMEWPKDQITKRKMPRRPSTPAAPDTIGADASADDPRARPDFVSSPQQPASPTAAAVRAREVPTYLLGAPALGTARSSLPKSGDAPAVEPPRLDAPAPLPDATEDERSDAVLHEPSEGELKRKELIARLETQSSLSGFDLSDADLKDLDLTGRDLANANFERARFAGANLSAAKLTGAVLRGAELRGVSLAEADLSDADLSGADLRGADLRGASLTGATLASVRGMEAQFGKASAKKAIFKGSDLASASFEGVDLREADMSGSSLEGATFAHAKLEGANLSGVTGAGVVFNGALLAHANLNQAKLAKGFFVRIVGQSSTWEEASLEQALFTEASLPSSHFGRANLTKADLSGANLSQARLRQAVCEDADFSSADLASARLQGVRASRAKWRNAKLDGADLREAQMPHAQMSQASMSRGWADRVDLSDAHLEGADLRRCSLRGANLQRADLRNANLQAADLRDADLTDVHAEGANTTAAKLAGACMDGYQGGGPGPAST